MPESFVDALPTTQQWGKLLGNLRIAAGLQDMTDQERAALDRETVIAFTDMLDGSAIFLETAAQIMRQAEHKMLAVLE
jgi:hypothetical protein